MSRKKVSPKTYLFTVVPLLAIVIGGAIYFAQPHDNFRAIQPLNAAEYAENANSLTGNTYKVIATVQNMLASDPTKGRLVSITTSDGGNIALLVPATFNEVNLQKGQRYVAEVSVTEHGVLTVKHMAKE